MPTNDDFQKKLLAEDADKWRLRQAEKLLGEAGFVPDEDGNWHPAPAITCASPVGGQVQSPQVVSGRPGDGNW